MSRLKIDILGVSETHWDNQIPESFEENGYVILNSPRNDNVHRQGVAMILSAKISQHMSDYNIYSERLMSITLDTNGEALTVFQVYAPDTSYSDTAIDQFYDQLQMILSALPQNQKFILMGDWNAKVGKESHHIWKNVTGKFSIGDCNARGEKLLQFCAINNFSLANTMYKHKHSRLVT